MTYQLIRGDSRRLPIADRSVHCVVTSPPYFALRDYGVTGQLGLEPTPRAYVQAMLQVFAEVHRVMRDDATLWLNIGDSFFGGGYSNHAVNGEEWKTAMNGDKRRSRQQDLKRANPQLKPKDLIGIPWMLAFALRDELGFYLRSDVIWHKPNPMPESVTDRPTKAHEYLFLLSKSADYFYDAEAVTEDAITDAPREHWTERDYDQSMLAHKQANGVKGRPIGVAGYTAPGRRNRRSVWTITTKPFKGSHFAVMPSDLVKPCIQAGTSEKGCCPECGSPWERVTEKDSVQTFDYEGKNASQDPQFSQRRMLANMRARRKQGHPHDNPFPSKKTLGWQPSCSCGTGEPVPCTVLDHFNGAGTTGVVALALGRRYIGVDLSADYLAMAQRRIDRPHALPVRTASKPEDHPLLANLDDPDSPT